MIKGVGLVLRSTTVHYRNVIQPSESCNANTRHTANMYSF